MAGKPDLSLQGFLASSATLDVQMQRAKHRPATQQAGKSFDNGWFGRKGSDQSASFAGRGRERKRHTFGNMEEFQEKELQARGFVSDDDDERPTRSFNLFGSFFGAFRRQKKEGDMSEVLQSISTDKYIRNQTLRDVLQNEDTVLIKGSWLVARWKQGKKDGLFGLPRRQELQAEHANSIWKVDELFEQKASGKVNIVAVSHCWLGSQHPDPNGSQLEILCTVIAAMLAGTPLEDLALFIDYCSLYQEPRTPEQEAAFTRAFPYTHLWYLHQGTRVWMLTKVNPKMERNEPYEMRGWPQLERALADMVTKQNFLLDLGKMDETCKTWQQISAACKHIRSVPFLPGEFNETVDRAVFAVEDDRPFVMTKYDEGFLEAICAAEELSFSDIGWGDDDAKQLAMVLPECGRLKKLALHGNKITEQGALALIEALGKNEALDQLWLTANAVSRDKKEVREKVFEAWVKTGRMRERLRL